MMVVAMRWTVFLLLSVLAGAAEIGGSNVRTIYILPMSHGLDQYVANRLTREGVLEVVADPTRADALLTDSLGKPLESELEKLHPTPKPQEQDADADQEDSDTPRAPRAKRTFTTSGSCFYVRSRQGHAVPGGRPLARGSVFSVRAAS